MAQELTVGEVARRSGVAVSALHFYETRGLIHSHRTAGNQRRYARDVLRRVAVIRIAQDVGISLADIAAALANLPDGRTPTREDWSLLSTAWRKDLDHRIEPGSHDEFERVAEHFNAMAAELQQHRKRADATRRELEDAVLARTRELEVAHQTLTRLDERRRQLFADLSHELRTPATSIRGEAEIALRGGDRSAEEYRQTLGRIVGGVKQLTAVVTDLLLIARAEADQLVIRPDWLDLRALVAETAEQGRTLARVHGVQLHLDLGEEELTVQADGERLGQAILILLDNAIRYSKPGGRVWFSLARHDAQACITVRDEGIGIDRKELASVFDRFVRGQRARQHRADGTGIGLSIAQSIVHAHRGGIQLASEPDQGTEATITLPCPLQAPPQDHSATP